MTKSTLKLSMVAAAIALSTLTLPAQAGVLELSRDTGVGAHIAAQGNAALRLIRAELTAGVLAMKPALPVRAPATKVSVAPAAGSVLGSANVRCAK